MAKGSDERNRMIRESYDTDRDLARDELAHTRQLRNEAQGRQNDTYSAAFGAYDNFLGGGLTPEELARLRGEFPGSGHSGGGPAFNTYSTNWGRYGGIEDLYRRAMAGGTVNQPGLREPQGTYREIMNSGGYNPDQLASMGESLGLLKGMGFTGGLDPYSIDRMRGDGVFDEYSKTGGVSDRDRLLLRDRGISNTNALYSGARREIDRLGRVQGQVGPGKSALLARMTRNNAQDLVANNRAAELDIMDRVNQGRQWGASNLANSEQNLQALKTGNMMQAITAALGFEQGLGNVMTQNRLAAGNMLGDSELDINKLLIDEGRWGSDKLFNLLQLQDAEGRANVDAGNSAAASAWSNSLNNEWDIINFMNRNRQFGAQGMHGLNDSNVNQTMGYTDMINNSRALGQQNANNSVTNHMNNNPSWWDQYGGYVTTAAALGGAAFTGGASLGALGYAPKSGQPRGAGSGYDYLDAWGG